MNDTISELVECADVVPLDSAIASATTQSRHGLRPPDAIVYASVLAHLSKAALEDSCFVTRDAKGFGVPEIDTELEGFNCRVIRRFDDALNFVKSKLRPPTH